MKKKKLGRPFSKNKKKRANPVVKDLAKTKKKKVSAVKKKKELPDLIKGRFFVKRDDGFLLSVDDFFIDSASPTAPGDIQLFLSKADASDHLQEGFENIVLEIVPLKELMGNRFNVSIDGVSVDRVWKGEEKPFKQAVKECRLDIVGGVKSAKSSIKDSEKRIKEYEKDLERLEKAVAAYG